MLKPAAMNDPTIFTNVYASRILPEVFEENTPLAPLNNYPYTTAGLADLTDKLDLLAGLTIDLLKTSPELKVSTESLVLFAIIQCYGTVLTEIKAARIALFCPDGQDILDFTPDQSILRSVPPNGEQQTLN